LRGVCALWLEYATVGLSCDKNKDKIMQLSETCKKSMIPLLEDMKNTSKAAAEYLAFLKQKGSNLTFRL
jgi:hypothetical protein